MKIIAINGSPKGKKSTTFFMVESFLKGAREVGAEATHYLLSTMKILPCRGCFTCWTKTPGRCVLKDDREKINLLDADLILYATPLYVDNVSGLMKNFMDRSIYNVLPYMELDSHGESVHVKKGGKSPMIMVMANSGFPEQSHFEVLKHLFQRLARNSRSQLIAEIYRGQGPLLRAGHEFKEMIDAYSALLERAGQEVVLNHHLCEETKKELEKPLIPHELYRQFGNRAFEEELSRLSPAHH